MKLKDLFKKIEAANFVASQIGGRKAYINCDELPIPNASRFNALSVANSQDGSYRFYNWEDFYKTIFTDYDDCVLELVEGENICNHGEGIFTLGNPDICKEIAFRFFIYRD